VAQLGRPPWAEAQPPAATPNPADPAVRVAAEEPALARVGRQAAAAQPLPEAPQQPAVLRAAAAPEELQPVGLARAGRQAAAVEPQAEVPRQLAEFRGAAAPEEARPAALAQAAAEEAQPAALARAARLAQGAQ